MPPMIMAKWLSKRLANKILKNRLLKSLHEIMDKVRQILLLLRLKMFSMNAMQKWILIIIFM